MTDFYTTELDTRDLKSRLNRIKRSNSTPSNGDINSQPRPTSSETDSIMSRLPAFRKSDTSSTTRSDEVSRLEVLRTVPLSSTHNENIEIGPGEFSKPSVRRRSASMESPRNPKEFRYYGRHANTWLFNDFSVTDSVKKGWGKVFSKSEEEQ